MVENPDQKPKGKQLQIKPAKLQSILRLRYLPIRDLGQERSLSPVSTWPVTASLKDALTSAGQWLTTLIFQGQVPSSHYPKVHFLGWVLWKMLWCTQQSSKKNREMLLPPKIHASATLAHCISVCIVCLQLAFSTFQTAKVKYTIFRTYVYSCASISSL